MIVIEEHKNGNETYYTWHYDNGTDKMTHKIYVKSAILTKDGIPFFMLYNTQMQVVSEAFSYINKALSNRSVNTKTKDLEALKFLVAYEEITGKKLQDFSLSDVDTLKYFLHGFSPAGQSIVLQLNTVRSNDTVNGYLSIYRGYLGHLGIKDHPLFSTTGDVVFLTSLDKENYQAKQRYKSNDISPRKFVEVPKYISVEEFIRIIEYIRAHLSIREEIIIRLMYQCGLRIGEVLGLTADDVIMVRQASGEYVPVAYIRNRVSDEKWQHAKSCMKVIDIRQYQTEDYNTLNYGFQIVPIPQDLFDLINIYIEDVHVLARNSSRSCQRYFEKALADRVRESEAYEDDNYYIFLNSIGTPLSIDSWNDILREIYAECNIVVDKNKRKNNLNHRFRHGFAMFHVMYCGVPAQQLAKLLRHSNINSVMCYYQPTISDQIKLKTKFAESLYELVPGLKRKDA